MITAHGTSGEKKYRSDIDGLRAISIIGVLVFHIKIPTDTRVSDGSCLKLVGVDVQGSSVRLANSDRPVVMFVGDSQAMALHSAIYRKLIDLPAVLVASHDKKAECLKQMDVDGWLKGNEPCQIAVNLDGRYQLSGRRPVFLATRKSSACRSSF